MTKPVLNVIGISGGKDSTALALWAKYESGYDPESIRLVFCDTGNEHAFTYRHVDLISERLFPVERIAADLDFWQLAEKKGRFPSPKVRFCTQVLKIFPHRDWIYELRDEFEVVSHSGVRGDESVGRKGSPEWEVDLTLGCRVRRPLVTWSIDDVLEIHRRYDFPLNPLYSFGARRVGCFPCIMSRKFELRIIAEEFPERIDLIRYWEERTDRTFYPPKKTPAAFRSKPFVAKDGREGLAPRIDDVVRWSKTAWGGKKFEFYINEPEIACDTSGHCE